MADSDRKRWIEETQTFQRNVGTPVTPTHELDKVWDSFNKARRKRELASVLTHRAIQDACKTNQG